MRPRCDACNLPAIRLPYRTQIKGNRTWKLSPYFMCPKCERIINIKCACGDFKQVEPQKAAPPTPAPDPTEAEVVAGIKSNIKPVNANEEIEFDDIDLSVM